MARESQEPTHWDLVPTLDTSEDVLLLWVKQTLLTPGLAGRTLGTTLKNFLAARNVEKDNAITHFGNYVLTGPGPRSGDGYLGYYFAAPKTYTTRIDANGDTTAWSDVTIIKDYDWPPVLRVLYAMSGTKRDGTDNIDSNWNRARPLVIERMELVPGGRYPAWHRIERFHAGVRWTDVEAERPVPTRVSWTLPNAAVYNAPQSLDCLHDDITFPELFIEGSPVPNWGTPPGAGALPYGTGQVYPATNMLDWMEHTPEDEMSELPENGIYTRRRVTVTPLFIPSAQLL